MNQLNSAGGGGDLLQELRDVLAAAFGPGPRVGVVVEGGSHDVILALHASLPALWVVVVRHVEPGAGGEGRSDYGPRHGSVSRGLMSSGLRSAPRERGSRPAAVIPHTPHICLHPSVSRASHSSCLNSKGSRKDPNGRILSKVCQIVVRKNHLQWQHSSWLGNGLKRSETFGKS